MKAKDVPLYSLNPEEHNSSTFFIGHMAEVERNRPNKIRVPHRHNYFTLIWIEDAQGKHYVEFDEHILSPNTLFFINPGQPHLLLTEGIPQGMVISFTEDFLCQSGIRSEFIVETDLFYQYGQTAPLTLNEEQSQLLRPLTKQLLAESKLELQDQEDIVRTYIHLFLLYCRRFKNREKKPSGALPQALILIKKFRDSLEHLYKQKHKVADYAELLAISPNHLNDIIHQHTGKRAKELIQDRIMLEAKCLAFFTESNLKEIAYELGFDDPAHFSKFFKNLMGQSFTDFREQAKQA